MNSTKWTAQDIPPQPGKTVLITGANSGLGFESARALAVKGAQIIMACRDLKKGGVARERILQDTPQASLDVMLLDLADLSSIRSFSEEFIKRYKDLHVLMNNAGINSFRRKVTADGHELVFGTNHLGHFALTGQLLPSLTQTPASRVVTVSSNSHYSASIDFDDLMSQRRYRMMSVYGQSKLANLLFARELHRRLQGAGHDTISLAAHPGFTDTNMLRKYTELSILAVIPIKLVSAMTHPVEEGVLPQLYAATIPGVEGGSYLVPNKEGRPGEGASSTASNDPALAKRLWEISESLTGVSFL